MFVERLSEFTKISVRMSGSASHVSRKSAPPECELELDADRKEVVDAGQKHLHRHVLVHYASQPGQVVVGFPSGPPRQ